MANFGGGHRSDSSVNSAVFTRRVRYRGEQTAADWPNELFLFLVEFRFDGGFDFFVERRIVLEHFLGRVATLRELCALVAHPGAAFFHDLFFERDIEKLMPLWRDIVWARTGAYRIGETFGRCYDETTYLADGRTLVIDRYRDVIEEVEDVELPH